MHNVLPNWVKVTPQLRGGRGCMHIKVSNSYFDLPGLLLQHLWSFEFCRSASQSIQVIYSLLLMFDCWIDSFGEDMDSSSFLVIVTICSQSHPPCLPLVDPSTQFILLFYKTGRARLVIMTANLVDYDWRDIENVRSATLGCPLLFITSCSDPFHGRLLPCAIVTGSVRLHARSPPASPYYPPKRPGGRFSGPF